MASDSPASGARMLRLAPHLIGRARRGVVGSSRYARTLRREIREAAADPQARAVLITGEPGLEKDNLAALIHFGSPARRQPMVRIDCARLRSDGAELFGAGPGGDPPLLECLEGGGLLLDQVDRADPALRPALLELARTGAWRSPDAPPEQRRFPGRVFLTAESPLPECSGPVRRIRVPALRVRRQDLGEWLRYGVRQHAGSLGWRRAPSVDDALVKRLQSHDFPGNLRELDELIERALRQCDDAPPAVLPEEVFWTPRRARPVRFELWRWKPWLREWMRAPLPWNLLLYGLVSWMFVLVNLWLWLGPQDRAHNGALNLFWAWWWPLVLLSHPLVGRLWCAVCPFMVWGEIVQRLSRLLGWRPRPWPRGNLDRWAAPLLAAGFAAILLWESLGNLVDTAWLSSCLLLLITAGAVVGSLLFEKRFWCRYLCPVGGMNGLLAKLAITELRAEAGTCSGSCTSYACFKGGPAEGEGMATQGCPLGTHPAHLEDNRNCVLCLTCAQACPHRSVQVRIRPPAADLQREADPPAGEAGLILVLAGGVTLHHWRPLLGGLPLAPGTLQEGPLLPRLAYAALALALPSIALLLLHLWRSLPRPRRAGSGATARGLFPWQLLYVLLPLLWALMLADHLPLGMAEAGRVLQVSAVGLGWDGPVPGWSADPHVVAFCQTTVLLVGAAGCIVLLRRFLPAGRRGWRLGSLLATALAAGGRWLLATG